MAVLTQPIINWTGSSTQPKAVSSLVASQNAAGVIVFGPTAQVLTQPPVVVSGGGGGDSNVGYAIGG